jgi:hypothetical protein
MRYESGFSERGRTMDEGGELREGYAEVGDQRLHYVEAGEGGHDEHERVNQLLIDFFAPALPAKEPGQVSIPRPSAPLAPQV